MNRIVLLYILLVAILPVYSQYDGGNDDGFAALSIAAAPLVDQSVYCSGGNDDGYSTLATGSVTLNNHSLYCSGGNNDGHAGISISGYFFNTALCYNGGENDGFTKLSTGSAHFNNPAIYLTGGANDGFSILNSGPAYFCDPSLYLSGGNSDGFAGLNSGNTTICSQSVYASGGNGDGFSQSYFSGPLASSTAWLGGISDGFSVLLSPVSGIAPAFYCFGGNNDGEGSLYLPSTLFGKGIWLGRINTNWNEPLNWSMDYIPDLTVNVLIPGGKTYYPLITSGNLMINLPQGNYTCNSLTIDEGGVLHNRSGLYIQGEVFISGLYLSEGEVNGSIFINPGGHLRLIAPGEVRVGEQDK